jgi:hypothetical protein
VVGIHPVPVLTLVELVRACSPPRTRPHGLGSSSRNRWASM